MTTLQLIGAKLSLCLPKLKHYGLFLGLCTIFVLTTALSPTEFTTDNQATEIWENTSRRMEVNSLMTQFIYIPNSTGIDTVMIEDCNELVSFESDQSNGVLYADTSARNSIIVICPPDASKFLKVTFSDFDLEEGDTLIVFTGMNTSGTLIGSGSGIGTHQMNGGWVGSNCDKTIEATGCLTFQFKTDGDNAKGAGWEAWVTCEQGTTTITPPLNQFVKLDCEEIKSQVTITAGEVVTDCNLSNDSLLVQVFNRKGALCKDTCLVGGASFVIDALAIGRYKVQHTLKAFPTITAINYVIISPPSLTCNDEVEAALGSSCLASIRPDYILEAPCDTTDNLYYDIIIMSENGDTIKTGTSRNGQYPVVSKEDVTLCGSTKYKVEITRVYDYNGSCCSEGLIKDVCWGYINFIDGTKPAFMTHSIDTLMTCGVVDFEQIEDKLTPPTITDNCDAVTLKMIDNKLISGDECSQMRTYLVTWQASDQCGNTAKQNDTLRVIRPNLEEIIKLPNVFLSCGEDNSETLEDYERLGIIKILLPNDTLTLSTEDYICNFILIKEDEVVPHPNGKKITRYWSVVDGCGNIPFPVRVDTQIIEFIDTLAPTIDCSEYNTLETAQRIALPAFKCAMQVILPKPAVSDICAEPTIEMFKVEQLEDGIWTLIGENLTEVGEVTCGAFRVSWEAKDISLGHSLALRDTCIQYFKVEDRTPPRAICGDEVQVSYDARGTRLYAAEVENQGNDACGIIKIEIRKESGEWAEYLDFFCEDVHKTFKAELRFTDKGGNTNICSFMIVLKDKIPPFCADLPDFEGTCDNFSTNQLGSSTDANENEYFNEDEWTDLTGDLLNEYNNKFGYPQCQDNLDCVPFTTQQQYQVIYFQCGIGNAKRRYRITDWNGLGITSNWKYQNIDITHTPGWSFTLPVDFFGECGEDYPDANIALENGACDLLGWEHKDQIFEIVPDACYKVIRTYYIINWCNYVQGQTPIELGREENIFGLVTQEKTINYQDVANHGYFTYIQILKVTDTEPPTVTINEVQTCIYGAGDAAPAGVGDQTPGAAPYECDTIRIFSAEATDCVKSDFSNFSFTYEIYEDGILVQTGDKSKLFWPVQPKVKYKVRFTTYDNCGNEGVAEKEYEFWDCTRPYVLCNPEINVDITEDSIARVDAFVFDKGSFDNCTPFTELRYKLWHPLVSEFPPNNEEEVAELPSTIYFDCDYRGRQILYFYVLDLEGNYDFCITAVNIFNNGGICTGDPLSTQAIVAGNIHTMYNEMVEAVTIEVIGEGDMPQAVTGANGDFSLSLKKGQTYKIKASKNDNPLNGVSTFDLIIISKHILGIESFSNPYQYIAADVNQSETVTAYDLVQLRQLILNTLPTFPNNESWRFVDAGYEFITTSPLTEPFIEAIQINNHQADKMNTDFVAVKIGDLNQSGLANNRQLSGARTAQRTTTIDITDKTLQVGEVVIVDFKHSQLQHLDGFQLALNFKGLVLQNIQEGKLKKHHFGQTMIDRNILTSSWDRWSEAEAPSMKNTHLFSIEFKALKAGKLSEFLQLQPQILSAEAYDETGEILDVDLHFAKTNTLLTLEQNRPNPFKINTSIGFQLPKAGKATLTILDLQGRILLQEAKDFSQGNHEWIIEGQSLTSKGILYYQLATNTEVLTKRMILIE